MPKIIIGTLARASKYINLEEDKRRNRKGKTKKVRWESSVIKVMEPRQLLRSKQDIKRHSRDYQRDEHKGYQT